MTAESSANPTNEAIELRSERIEQLFDNLDPSPFHERALDASALQGAPQFKSAAGERAVGITILSKNR